MCASKTDAGKISNSNNLNKNYLLWKYLTLSILVLGLKCYAIEEVPDQKVRTAFFKLGQTKIELLEPTSEDSTIAGFIEKRGIGIHHMALAVKNIEEQLADAEAKGIRLIDKTPRKGAEGMTIAFLHPKSTQGILTELCEDKNN